MKFDSKALEGIFEGHAYAKKDYRIGIASSKQIKISDVILINEEEPCIRMIVSSNTSYGYITA